MLSETELAREWAALRRQEIVTEPEPETVDIPAIIMEIIADGRERTVEDVRTALAARGVSRANTTVGKYLAAMESEGKIAVSMVCQMKCYGKVE